MKFNDEKISLENINISYLLCFYLKSWNDFQVKLFSEIFFQFTKIFFDDFVSNEKS